MKKLTDAEWVEKWVPDTDGCWPWAGCTQKDGYGSVTRAGETLAHRAIYKILIGPIPDGLELDHTCKNRRCINPSHLEPVTHAENVRRGDHKTNHRNSVKTHCMRGHAFTPQNTLTEQYGDRFQRKCRTCCNERQRNRKAKARAQTT